MGKKGPRTKTKNSSENCEQSGLTWQHAKIKILNFVKLRIPLAVHSCVTFSYKRLPLKRWITQIADIKGCLDSGVGTLDKMLRGMPTTFESEKVFKKKINA